MLLRLLLLRVLSPRLYGMVLRAGVVFLLLLVGLAGWIAVKHAQKAFSPEAIRQYKDKTGSMK